MTYKCLKALYKIAADNQQSDSVPSSGSAATLWDMWYQRNSAKPPAQQSTNTQAQQPEVSQTKVPAATVNNQPANNNRSTVDLFKVLGVTEPSANTTAPMDNKEWEGFMKGALAHPDAVKAFGTQPDTNKYSNDWRYRQQIDKVKPGYSPLDPTSQG